VESGKITIKVEETNCRKRLLKTSAIIGSEQKFAAGGCFIRLVCVWKQPRSCKKKLRTKSWLAPEP
jgi:hypothetical protein